MPTGRETGRERTFHVSRSACSVRHMQRNQVGVGSAGDLGRETHEDLQTRAEEQLRKVQTFPMQATWSSCGGNGGGNTMTRTKLCWALKMHRSQEKTLAMAQEACTRLTFVCLSRAKRIVHLMIETMPFDRIVDRLGQPPVLQARRLGEAHMPKLRAGSDAAARLLASGSSQEWTEAFDSYDESVKRLSQEKGRAGLVELDRWWREDFTAALDSRGAHPYLTKEELVMVVQWKLWIGVVRPNLLRFASETDAEKVKTKSRDAFQLLRPPSETSGRVTRVSLVALRKAVTALTSDLKGVGPATASAVLAAQCGGCPFDADEVIDAVMKTGVRKYSLPEYLEVAETLDSKAESLGTPWDAERVRKALWSRAMHSRFDIALAPARSSAASSKSHKAAIASDVGVGVLDRSEGKGAGKGKKGGCTSSCETTKSGRAKRHKSSR